MKMSELISFSVYWHVLNHEIATAAVNAFHAPIESHMDLDIVKTMSYSDNMDVVSLQHSSDFAHPTLEILYNLDTFECYFRHGYRINLKFNS